MRFERVRVMVSQLGGDLPCSGSSSVTALEIRDNAQIRFQQIVTISGRQARCQKRARVPKLVESLPHSRTPEIMKSFTSLLQTSDGLCQKLRFSRSNDFP